MAYAQQSNDYKQPPPYVEHEQMRDGMPYQTQERPPPVQQGYYGEFNVIEY